MERQLEISVRKVIAFKVVAGRNKDWLDVEALLIEQRGKLDMAYVENWIVQFADVLKTPQMLAHYRRLMKLQAA